MEGSRRSAARQELVQDKSEFIIPIIKEQDK